MGSANAAREEPRSSNATLAITTCIEHSMQKKRSFASVGIGHLMPTLPDFGAVAHDAGSVRRARHEKKATRDNPNSVYFVRFHFEMFHEQPAAIWDRE